MRSANVGSSSQVVTVSLNAFDNTAGFLGGRNLIATATSSWGYFDTISYQNVNTATADLAFRLAQSGPNNSILIAIPTINGILDSFFSDGFEAPPVVP